MSRFKVPKRKILDHKILALFSKPEVGFAFAHSHVIIQLVSVLKDGVAEGAGIVGGLHVLDNHVSSRIAPVVRDAPTETAPVLRTTKLVL